MVTKVLQFRLDPPLVEQLDEEAAALGVSRAALVRMLVMQGLGEPAMRAAIREAHYSVAPVIRRSLARVLKGVQLDLPRVLEEEIARGGFPAVAAE